MATHSSTLAWRIPWTAEPVGVQSMGPHRVRLDGNYLALHEKQDTTFKELMDVNQA